MVTEARRANASTATATLPKSASRETSVGERSSPSRRLTANAIARSATGRTREEKPCGYSASLMADGALTAVALNFLAHKAVRSFSAAVGDLVEVVAGGRRARTAKAQPCNQSPEPSPCVVTPPRVQ